MSTRSNKSSLRFITWPVMSHYARIRRIRPECKNFHSHCSPFRTIVSLTPAPCRSPWLCRVYDSSSSAKMTLSSPVYVIEGEASLRSWCISVTVFTFRDRLIRRNPLSEVICNLFFSRLLANFSILGTISLGNANCWRHFDAEFSGWDN